MNPPNGDANINELIEWAESGDGPEWLIESELSLEAMGYLANSGIDSEFESWDHVTIHAEDGQWSIIADIDGETFTIDTGDDWLAAWSIFDEMEQYDIPRDRELDDY